MAHVCTSKIAGPAFLFVLIGTLLLLYSSTVLAQAPSFEPAVYYGSGGYGDTSLAVGDVNGDGIPDIVVSNRCVVGDTCPNGEAYICVRSEWCSHGAVGVLLGNGDGTFRPPITYETSGYYASSLALGDLNGDGRLDVVVVNTCGTPPDVEYVCPYGTVDVMFGNGAGSLDWPFTRVLRGWYPMQVKLGDLNGDGKLDAVISNTCRAQSTCSDAGCTCDMGSMDVLLNNGYGNFWDDRSYESEAPWSVTVGMGDVNGDGKLDVLVGDSRGIGSLLGNGDGTLQPVIYSPQVMPSAFLAIEDVNRDGKSDVLIGRSRACTSCDEGLVTVLLSDGDGTFHPSMNYGSGGSSTHSIAVADMNGDGKVDLLVINAGSMGVLFGNGDGTFQKAVSVDLPGWATSVAVADLNGDGKPDLVVESGGVRVLLNNTPFCTTPPKVTVSASPQSLWPPTGKIVPVEVSGKITETGNACTTKAAAYEVQDEYGQLQPSGPVNFDANGAYSFTVWLRASRLGTDLDGRSYNITVRASNNAGKMGSKGANIGVPHDQGHGKYSE